MLKKGKWLKQWKHLILKNTDFRVDTIDDWAGTAILDYKDGLSPIESVEYVIDARDEVAESLMIDRLFL